MSRPDAATGAFANTDPVAALVDFLGPVVAGLLRRIDPEIEEFTTIDFIDVMQDDPAAADAYEAALRRWGEDPRRAKMVVHGQVIPLAMRLSGLVEWAGFAHGEEDEYAVPARWRLLPPAARPERDRVTDPDRQP